MTLSRMRHSAARATMLAVAGAMLATAPPAFAQDDAGARIRKLEAEVRALQRRVFPGADGRYFEADIQPEQRAPTTSNAPSTTAVTDILARLDALEASLQRLTGQVEENSNALSGLTTRLAAVEQRGAAAVTGDADETSPASDSNLSAMTGGASSPSTSATTPRTTGAAATSSAAVSTADAAAPSPARLAAVQQIMKPQTDDAGDDEYSYGFRLWEAGFFPEAQQQLTMFVEKYPDHWRTSYGRNLLGRAYLDDGKAREAAPWFLRNYQGNKSGERAPDSLLFLAEAMIELEDTNRACIALAEFGETYPAVASGRLSSEYEASRRKVTCSG